MENNRSIYILCDSYPFGFNEVFLDSEIEILSKSFNSVYIETVTKERSYKRRVPKNVIILEHNDPCLPRKILLFLQAIFFKALWFDFFKIPKQFNQKRKWIHLKILLSNFIVARKIEKQILISCKKNAIDFSSTIFYSYWHDSKALALCFLKKRYKIIALARAHGWDMDYSRHQPAYLPFKNFIIKNLDLNVSISSFGINKLKEMSNEDVHYKIIKKSLGIKNSKYPHFKKNEQKIIICSCSRLIPLKRVDSIIKAIGNLIVNHVHWIHFGDGPLKKELEILASKYTFTFDFKGNVNNESILDFYNKNYVDLFINLSVSEGIPVSIMEAQSAGIPVLATNVGGTPEIVNNENGILVEKDETNDAIAQKIEDYLNLPDAEKLKKRELSYKNWKQNFNAEKNYSHFTKTILEL